ncbi:MAG: single-stranded-DNA-specific exonuclease RecJ [Candidatus Paceibacterota bacterium]
MKTKYQWHIKDTITKDIISQYPEISPLILQLLWNRGIKSDLDIDNFLNSDYQDLLNPFLILDMQKSIDRIIKALKNKEKIIIFGDYDADGVTGSTILYQGLKTTFLALHQQNKFSIGNNINQLISNYIEVYIPDRHKEGYGLKDIGVSYILQSEAKVVLTVDCGVRSKEEIQVIQNAGIDVIVIDHHSVPEEMPPAFGIIVPKRKGDPYPFKDLCGAGLAFKVMTALLTEARTQVGYNFIPLGYEKWLLDLTAIGTIADMVPLVGENRIIVRYGLYVLGKTRNIGLRALIDNIGITTEVDEIDGIDERSISVYSVGFQIAPRINAAGRIAHANQAFQLFTTEINNEATNLAEELQKLNDNRKALTDNVLKEVEARLLQYENIKNQALIFEGDKNWSIGVLGIVASRLTEKYYRPVILYQEQSHHCVASARSIPEFDIAKTVQKMESMIISGGGHSQAAGITFDNHKKEEIETFFKNQIRETVDINTLQPYKNIDMELNAQDVDWGLYDIFYKLSPFGMNNSVPVFLVKKLRILDIKVIGADQKHIKLKLSSEAQIGSPLTINAIGFNFGHIIDELHRNDIVDLVFKLEVNEWNGNRELQLNIVDIASNES